MTTLLVSHADCLAHDTSPGHPESSDRLRAVMRALEGSDFQALVRENAPLASDEQILRAHPQSHISGLVAAVEQTALMEHVRLDADTIVSAGSMNAARRAAGAVCHAVGAVARGEVRNAFCAIRPPGHHAEQTKAMGFCLFNNVVVGAMEARAVYGLERVVVIDFDVHHGNGSQAMAWDDPNLFYASTHQAPLYPGTGDASETGYGTVVNVPLAPESDGRALRQAMEGVILPALEDFAPDLIMISAGFDAHRDDPLANLNFAEADYIWITEALCDVAERLCDGRVVSSLEGGYNLEALADSAAAHVRTLMRYV